MVKYIESNGKNLPVMFGMTALSQFCDDCGMSVADMESFGQAGNMKLSQAISLVYHGLKDGARKEKKPFDFSKEEVGDLIDEDPELIGKVMGVFANSQAKSEGKGKPRKVKA